MDGFHSIGDFHGGAYESEFVSPWTKSAQKPDAQIMVVAQDWASEDYLSGPLDQQLIALGYDPNLPTNRNLQALLRRHFGVDFSEVFATNIFPFVKPGTMTGSISIRAVATCAQEFLFPQIEIVRPKLVICLGITTYNGLLRAAGLKTFKTLKAAIGHGVEVNETSVQCLAHTGARGTNNRGQETVDSDWKAISEVAGILAC